MVAGLLAEKVQVLRLAVSDLTLGVCMSRIFGIERAERLRPSSDSPGHVGVIQNRAGQWPTYALSSLLGIPGPEETRQGKVILVELNGVRSGLLVDSVHSVNEKEEILPVPASIPHHGLYSGVVIAEQPLLVLNLDQLEAAGQTPVEPPFRRRLPLPGRTSVAASTNRLLIMSSFEHPVLERRVGFGVPIHHVAEILYRESSTPVPGVSQHVSEMVAWRGLPVPVFDLIRWCGLDCDAPFGNRLAILKLPRQNPFAVVTATNPRILTLPVPHVPMRHKLVVNEDRLLGKFDLNDMTLLLPDLQQLGSAD